MKKGGPENADSTQPATDPAGNAREIEVKLAGSRDVLSRLLDFDILAGAAPHPRAQKLLSTYFDTEDDALSRAGMSLRIRKAGARRLMTLKWTPQAESVFSRGEVEIAVDSETPALGAFEPALAAIVEEAAGAAPLIPRFETRVRRRVADLRTGSASIEIAIDEGEIVTPAGGALRISECELELKEGQPAEVFSLAARLTRAGLSLNPSDKSQRGYRLACGETPCEVRAIEPHFAPDTRAEEAIAAIIDCNIRQFFGNWPALAAGDHEESVHQARVALRRLRTALGLFEKALPGAGFERFREDARRIGALLGPARDLDAFMAFVSNGPLTRFARDESFEALLAAAAARRPKAFEAARETIKSPETSRFVLELQAFVAMKGWRNGLGAQELEKLSTPARAFAAQALERRHRRARRLGKDILGMTPEERHRLRISLKNLRYATDFFGSLFEDRAGVRKFSKMLATLQDSLGAHNDAMVALGAVADFEREAGPIAARAAGVVMGWCGHEAGSPDVDVTGRWLEFKQARCFWR